MPLLDEKTRGEVEKLLSGIVNPVRIVTFTQEFECDSCHDARELAEEIASIHPKISHETYDLVNDKEKAEEMGVDKVPATVVAADGGARIRFYGVPGGYEFSTLLQDLLMVSSGDSGLSPAAKEKVKRVDKPLHLQVLVTPT